jgi:Protein of unknown function (DUF2628)
MAEAEFVNDPALNAKWNTRFAFFDRYGKPNGPQYKEELKKRPRKQQIIVNANIFALFFGPIYFFILGLWKKGLALLGIQMVLGAVLSVCGAPGFLFRGVGFAFALFYMLGANYSYYLKRVKGQDGWNPFEGMRF